MNLFLVEGVQCGLGRHVLEDKVITLSGLQDDPAWPLSAARPPRKLGHKTIGALSAAEVRHQQHVVHPDDRSERDAWEVVAFGDQLCSDQHLALPIAECTEDSLVCPSALGRICVHPRDFGSRQRFLEGLLYALCPVPKLAHLRAT